MYTETFRVEIECKDGNFRTYRVSCDELLEMIAKNVNYYLIIE